MTGNAGDRHSRHGDQEAPTGGERASDGPEPAGPGVHAAHPMAPPEAAGAGGQDAHGMTPEGPSPAVRAKLEHLQEMRALQALLERARRRELAEQRRQDAEAQRLMDTDPRGHIAMMHALQEQQALVRELPPALLTHEAAVFREIVRAREAERSPETRELGMGVLMAWHLTLEHWAHIAVMPLGAWLVASPSAFGYRSAALAWSDIVSGLLIVAFGALSMGRRPWAPWANAIVGLWLMLAPLALWAPDAVAYANDTLVGMLVIAFAVIIPMRTEMPGPDVPPGWIYSPASWLQRAPVIALAFVSFFMSRYMAAFQLGHIPAAWDPIFGRGTEVVLTSEVSRAFPVSDAGLGAYTYLIEILSGLMGDARRWRTMPWMVALFGFAVVPLGVSSVILIMLQPVAVGAWCTPCLASALLMLIMVALSLDEIVAMIQFLIIGRREGRSAWRLFWAGGTLRQRVEEVGLERRRTSPWAEMVWGVSVPWTLLASAAVGGWLLAAPSAFGRTGAAANVQSVLGALAFTVAFIAFAEVGRSVRFLNVPIGLAIAVAPWFVGGASPMAHLNAVVGGILVIALSIPRGPIRNRYGGWDPFIV